MAQQGGGEGGANYVRVICLDAIIVNSVFVELKSKFGSLTNLANCWSSSVTLRFFPISSAYYKHWQLDAAWDICNKIFKKASPGKDSWVTPNDIDKKVLTCTRCFRPHICPF